MSVIVASLGTQEIKIETKNIDMLAGGLTPFMREQLQTVLESHAAKADVTHASLKIGSQLIETGKLPAAGQPRSDVSQAFVGAVQQKVESLLSSFMEHGAPIDYNAFPSSGNSQPAPAPVRTAKVDPSIIPAF